MNTNQPTPPATAAEREAAAQEARQKGDFDQRIEAATQAGDLNLVDHLRHARAARDLDVTTDRRASLIGDVARAEARLARAGQLDKEAAGAELVRLRKELANVEGEIGNLQATVQRGPLVTARAPSEDWSDSLAHRVMVRVFDGLRESWLPVANVRGLRAAAAELASFDPELDVVVEDSRGFRYRIDGREIKLLDADGNAYEIMQGATDQRLPLLRHPHAKLPPVDANGKAVYSAPLRLADLRNEEERENDKAALAVGMKAPVRDYSPRLRELFGVRLARRK